MGTDNQPPMPTECACRLRFIRGLQLNETLEYKDNRVAEIAKRQAVLYKEIDDLDSKLERISGRTIKEMADEYWGNE